MDKADSPYSNREIREKWNDIASTLQEIKTQTKLTNGRVYPLFFPLQFAVFLIREEQTLILQFLWERRH